MISFIPWIGKVQTGQSSGGFTVIIPLNKGQNWYLMGRITAAINKLLTEDLIEDE